MKEVKSPKKPLIYYYGIVLLFILVFNMVVSPLLLSASVKEVDYGTFMKMIEEKNIGSVEVTDSEIVFTDKDNEQIYKTGEMNDPTLTERLYASGAKFPVLYSADPDFRRSRAISCEKNDVPGGRSQRHGLRYGKE